MIKSMNKNPLFAEINEPIKYSLITVDFINEAVVKSIEQTKNNISKIYTIKPDDRTFENTMLALDAATDVFGKVFSTVYLTGYTKSDDDIRNAALENIAVLSKYGNELSLDEKLYKAIKEYSDTNEAKSLKSYKKKYLNDTIKEFERNGLGLPEDKRNELKKLKDELSEVSLKFSSNISASKGEMIVGEAEIKGLAEDYKKQHRIKDGTYKITLENPSYRPFMKYADSDKARKKLYVEYYKRAAEENPELLKQMLKLRKEIALKLGYKTFAEYKLEDKMAKNPTVVWDFEQELQQKLINKAKADYSELLEMKREHLGDSMVKEIAAWDVSYYTNKVLENEYSVDDLIVKQYFEVDKVIDGLFKICQELFDVTFKKVNEPDVWHEDVKMFEVFQEGKLQGRFYLDLHPRDNKYQHAAMFPLVDGRMTLKGYQAPVVALVCNFPKATDEKPALLPHSEVETFFHEFGHLTHHLLTKSPIGAMAGTSVTHDFVETPSQLLENWAWNYDSLKLFAKHYETNEVLPKDLFDKMRTAKNVCSGTQTLQQVFYGTIDMTLHDKYDPESNVGISEIVKGLQNEITLFKFVEGTKFEAAFGHLSGYAAGYYGYLWSLVFSEDIFSVFEEKGILDKETGIRYRDLILASGGTRDENEIIHEFLGREPNQDAFLKSLGLVD